MSKSEISGPFACFTIENGETEVGFELSGTPGNKKICLFNGTVPVDETISSIPEGDRRPEWNYRERLTWAYVLSSGEELKLLPCKPPQAGPRHAFQTLVKVVAHDKNCCPLFDYNSQPISPKILQAYSVYQYAESMDSGFILLATLGYPDVITVYTGQQTEACRNSQTFKRGWSVSADDLFDIPIS